MPVQLASCAFVGQNEFVRQKPNLPNPAGLGMISSKVGNHKIYLRSVCNKIIDADMGNNTAKDPAIHRMTFRMNSADYRKFTKQFRQSGQENISRFIVSILLNREMKVVKIDKAAMDYYMRLTAFYNQYQAVGNNYNQLVKAVKTNFGEKRGLSMLYKLEKTTIELIAITQELFALTDEFEKQYLKK